MTKKKILFLIPNLGGGGAERVLVNLVNGMDKSKYDITVQCIFKAGINAAFLDSNVRLKEGGIKQFSGNVMLMKLFSPKTLYKLIVGEHYDVAISYLEGVSARIISGCPYRDTKKLAWIHVVHKSDADTYYSFRSKEEAVRCYCTFDSVLHVSRDVMKDFIRYYPMLKNNKVIYNVNDDERIRKLAAEPLGNFQLSKDINIVSVGRLIDMKGFARLIDAHHRLKQDGIKTHVYILGSGERQDALQSQIIRNGDADTVHLLGFCDNPYKVVSRCDLFVCSSHREGFSTAVTEALILGIPVVTTCVSGAYEQMGEKNEYGIVTESNTDALYSGLRRILQEEGCLDYYRKQAKLRGSFFSKENAVKSVEEIIDFL